MYGIVPMVHEDPIHFKPGDVFTYEGDYLGMAVEFFLPLYKKESLRVEIGNHFNDADDKPFDTNYFSFIVSLQEVFEKYLVNHTHDAGWFDSDDCCQDYHQEWARWLHDYADRLERNCLSYASQRRKR